MDTKTTLWVIWIYLAILIILLIQIPTQKSKYWDCYDLPIIARDECMKNNK